jgi:hypothetical protein
MNRAAPQTADTGIDNHRLNDLPLGGLKYTISGSCNGYSGLATETRPD